MIRMAAFGRAQYRWSTSASCGDRSYLEPMIMNPAASSGISIKPLMRMGTS